MLVGVVSFGSVWRRRFGPDPGDPERFRRAAYFNTTGVWVNGRVVRHRKVAGHARFNGAGGFDSCHSQRAIGGVFECDELFIMNGQRKLFFGRRLVRPQPPDYFLVAIRSADFGRIDVGVHGWKSDGTQLISFSEGRDQQEVLLLIPECGWVMASTGLVMLRRVSERAWIAVLEICR